MQPGERRVVERGHDEQHEIGTGGAGLEYLVRLGDEVFAQHRNVDRGAHRGEIVEAAPEPALLREHAHRGGAAGRVGASEIGRVGNLREGAPRGARALHFRDDLDALAALERRARVEGAAASTSLSERDCLRRAASSRAPATRPSST